jgi:hypothetical protein
MAKKPLRVDIRSFQVGFGDCFLLSFVYADRDQRHMLIDFGTTGLPPSRSKNAPTVKTHMPRIANEIAQICGSRGLTALVATHRHADHISGFGTDARTGESGKIIRSLKPKVVIQPWTEDPKAKRNATKPTSDSVRSPKSFVAALGAMHRVAEQALQISRSRPAWMSARLAHELQFLGMENIKNESAVRNLIAMGNAAGATAVWASHGANARLGRLLPGVKVNVLGPPTLAQSEGIRVQRSKDPDQFWHLLAADPVKESNAFEHGLLKRGARGAVPSEARWFRERLDEMRGEQLLEIVRTLDDQMNNTSVILLFEVFGKKLLFPGDAQLENWSYALQDAPDARKTQKLLAGVDLYKVGHHGSLNATPKKLLWENFEKRKGRKLTTMLSTLPGKHGHSTKRTEVPRKTLLEALRSDSRLFNTDELPWGVNPEPFHLVSIEPT